MAITKAELARIAELFRIYELSKRGGAVMPFPPRRWAG